MSIRLVWDSSGGRALTVSVMRSLVSWTGELSASGTFRIHMIHLHIRIIALKLLRIHCFLALHYCDVFC